MRNKLSSITSRSNKKLNKDIKYNEINELIGILKKTKKLLDNKGIKLFFIYMPREMKQLQVIKTKKLKKFCLKNLRKKILNLRILLFLKILKNEKNNTPYFFS